jgi:hypothetical protein
MSSKGDFSSKFLRGFFLGFLLGEGFISNDIVERLGEEIKASTERKSINPLHQTFQSSRGLQ